MGQQQLLLIILGVIIVGIAIAVGLSLFSAQSIQSNKDAIINDINNVAAHAYQFRIRPTSMAGGGGVYDDSKGGKSYTIPLKMQTNENAEYTVVVTDADHVEITGTNANYAEQWVKAVLNENGELGTFEFGPAFN
jgi:hypothetical protein